MQKDMRYRLLCIGTLLVTASLLLLFGFIAKQNSSQPTGAQIIVRTQANHEIYYDTLHTLTVIEQNGKVCVLKDGNPWIQTEISVQALPEKDRTMLEKGITVRSEKEMHQLLEDLGV